MPFFVYILYSAALDQYYVGYSEDLDDRSFRHTNSGSKATKKAKDWRSEAYNREIGIKKKKSRNYIEWLISHPDSKRDG